MWFRSSTALTEIILGTSCASCRCGGQRSGRENLTSLAGAELDPTVFRAKWKEATVVGLVGFIGPFFGCAAVAHYILHWSVRSSWLGGGRSFDHLGGGRLRGHAGAWVQRHGFW